jgi:hypothetical protein
MNLIIAGGRHFNDYQLALDKFNELFNESFDEVDCIFSGCAKGADLIGERIAAEKGIQVSRFPADWDYYGKKAGILRNENMAEWADCLLAFWDGISTGTKHMIEYARSQGLEVYVVIYKEKKMETPLNVIFDLETVDTKPSAALASIAIIVFDPSTLQDFDTLVNNACRIKFKINEQFQAPFNRTFSKSTVEWWKSPEQAEAYQKVIAPSNEDVSITELPRMLKAYLDKMGYKPNVGEKVYCRGMMDTPILEDVLRMCGAEPLMPWWSFRDVRTEIDAIAPYWDGEHQSWGNMKSFVNPSNFVKHVEIMDCAIDVMKMQYAHLKLIEKMGE